MILKINVLILKFPFLHSQDTYFILNYIYQKGELLKNLLKWLNTSLNGYLNFLTIVNHIVM